MNRVNNKNHIDLLVRSLSNNFTASDRAATKKSLENFSGVQVARDYFKKNNYRKWKCCICGCDFYDRTGCNPDPVVPITEHGEMPVCCHDCNALFVIPARS